LLPRVTAERFDRQADAGRTRPCLMVGVDDDGNEVEVFVKLSASPEITLRSLVTECVSALLAKDLGLNVPDPYLVRIEPGFAETIPISEVRERVAASVGYNFGSKRLPPQHTILNPTLELTDDQIQQAVEILAFDTFIANVDRRVTNPNLLVSGSKLMMIDHELAFRMDGIIGWKNPWESGAINLSRSAPNDIKHAVLDRALGSEFNLDRFTHSWKSLSDEQIQGYNQVLPSEWQDQLQQLDEIVAYIFSLRDNIDGAVAEFKRALT